MRVEVRPGVAVTLGGQAGDAAGPAVGRGRRDARRAVAGRADPADHRSRRPPRRARQGHEERGAREVQGPALLPDRSALPRRRDVRAEREAGFDQRAERAGDGREHAQPRHRVVHDRRRARRASRCASTRCWSRARRSCSSSSAIATAGKTTYGAGRFLYADPPVDGKVVLDFNRAYSPPCAFTPTRRARCRPPATSCRWRSRRARCSRGTR